MARLASKGTMFSTWPFVHLLSNTWTQYFENEWTDFDAKQHVVQGQRHVTVNFEGHEVKRHTWPKINLEAWWTSSKRLNYGCWCEKCVRLESCSKVSIDWPPSATMVSAEPFSHRTGILQCLQKKIATCRHWSVSLWRDPDDVSHCWILSSDKTEWRLIPAALCRWRRCFLADQLWCMTCIQEEVWT